MPPLRYSVIIPVYNRPEELDELLGSLVAQTFRNFEVIIVEDGSSRDARSVYEKYTSTLTLQYIVKLNSGPGPSRNMGFSKAKGEFFVVFDSDCILPPGYFQAVEDYFKIKAVDAWGGPDRGHENFTPLQQAMAFTMSSFLTTGGIRGGKNQADDFQPRSFNMGISRKVFERTGGFKFDRLAEDVELSIRIRKEGFKVALIPDAFVYHKRRTTLYQFFRQVMGFGRGRVRVGKVHPEAIKVTHWFPTCFMLGALAIPYTTLFNPRLSEILLMLYAAYLLAIAVDAIRNTGSLWVSVLCIPSAIVQLFGYGWGFIKEQLKPTR